MYNIHAMQNDRPLGRAGEKKRKRAKRTAVWKRRILALAAGTLLFTAATPAVWAAPSGDADTIHYFSVKPHGGNAKGNYLNDGAVGTNSIAVGAGAHADGTMGAAAFGNDAHADGERALAVGSGAYATGLDTISIGTAGASYGARGSNSIAIGAQAATVQDYSLAIGGYTKVTAIGGTALGHQAAAGEYGTSVGAMARSSAPHASAVGMYSSASETASTALGGFSKAGALFGTALGYGASVTAVGGVALGAGTEADVAAGREGYRPAAGAGDASPAWKATQGAVSLGKAAGTDENGRPTAQVTRQITHLAAGTDDTDAVNVAQLKAVNETAQAGWTLRTNGSDAAKARIAPGDTVDLLTGNDNLELTQEGSSVTLALQDHLDLTGNDEGEGSIRVGDRTSFSADALTLGGLTFITSRGINANGRVITNVAPGVADTDAVNVAQLRSVAAPVTISAGEGIIVERSGTNYTIKSNLEGLSNVHGTVEILGSGDFEAEDAGQDRAQPARKSPVMRAAAEEPETDDGGKVFVRYLANEVTVMTEDGNSLGLNDGDVVKVVGDDNIDVTSSITEDANGGAVDTLHIALSSDITANSLTINQGGPVIQNEGIDMKDHKIINVTDGEISETSRDAVNGRQLYQVQQGVQANAEGISRLDNRVSRLDSRISKVGAGAAALAALHPQDFDPEDKWDFAMGYGNYRDANAMAVGAFYRPDHRTMISAGGTFGNGENMINVGLSLKLGKNSPYAGMSRHALIGKVESQAREISALQDRTRSQDERIAKLEALVSQLAR